MDIAIVIISLGLLVFLSHLFSKLLQKTRIPDVLILVLIGLLVGPITGLVPVEAFGKVGSIFTTIALVIILFESGLDLSFSTIRESMMKGVSLTVINFLATVLVLDSLFIFLLKMSFLESLIMASILGGTSSAVVIPMVSKLRIQEDTRTALILESTFSDVLCIVITLGFIKAILYNELRPSLMLGQIISAFLLAALMGALAAFFWSTVLSQVRRLENGIFLTPAFVFIVFGIAELLGYSGAISALAFGIVLGNIQDMKVPVLKKMSLSRPVKLSKTEKAFFSEIAFVLKTFFFAYVGISIHLNNVILILTGLVVTVVLFLIRIPVVRLAFNSTVSKFDASMASVIVPKGLAAAVLASYLMQAGIENAVIMQDVVYAVILFSIIATTALIFFMEKGTIRKLYGSCFPRCAVDELSNEK